MPCQIGGYPLGPISRRAGFIVWGPAASFMRNRGLWNVGTCCFCDYEKYQSGLKRTFRERKQSGSVRRSAVHAVNCGFISAPGGVVSFCLHALHRLKMWGMFGKNNFKYLPSGKIRLILLCNPYNYISRIFVHLSQCPKNLWLLGHTL